MTSSSSRQGRSVKEEQKGILPAIIAARPLHHQDHSPQITFPKHGTAPKRNLTIHGGVITKGKVGTGKTADESGDYGSGENNDRTSGSSSSSGSSREKQGSNESGQNNGGEQEEEDDDGGDHEEEEESDEEEDDSGWDRERDNSQESSRSNKHNTKKDRGKRNNNNNGNNRSKSGPRIGGNSRNNPRLSRSMQRDVTWTVSSASGGGLGPGVGGGGGGSATMVGPHYTSPSLGSGSLNSINVPPMLHEWHKPGKCPPLSTGLSCLTVSTEAAQCSSDGSCPGSKKCCYNACAPYDGIGICEFPLLHG